MITVFKVFSPEPIENVITFMNFKVDKAIFFGSPEIINNQKIQIENFLRNYCNVKHVIFISLLPIDLNPVVDTLHNELAYGNKVCLDMTGGEDLLVLAFDRLAMNYNLPLHFFDIKSNRPVLLNKKQAGSIINMAEHQKVDLNIDSFIELYGGKIATRNETKIIEEVSNIDDDLKAVAEKYKEEWNAFSDSEVPPKS